MKNDRLRIVEVGLQLEPSCHPANGAKALKGRVISLSYL